MPLALSMISGSTTNAPVAGSGTGRCGCCLAFLALSSSEFGLMGFFNLHLDQASGGKATQVVGVSG